MKKNSWSFKIGLIIMTVLIIIIVISYFYTPYNANAMNQGEKFSPPGFKHIMGTDNFGRDIFSRIMEGMKTTFVVSLSTVSIGTFFGILIGAFTGYYGGWLDEIIMRLNDTLTAFPSILLALVFVSILGTGKYHIIIALGIIFIPSFARIIRSEFIKYRNLDYVKSAKLIGASDLRIIFIHILPNCMPILLASVAVGFNNAVLAESGMSYLGIGVQPPDASLGRMLSEAQGYLFAAPWCAVFPGMVIILMIIGFVLLSDGLNKKGGFKV